MSSTSSQDQFRFIRTSGGISEYVLESNSLRVLLLEDHSAPVVTAMVTYHVGSRNEAIGYTGATHLLEHLMFKGKFGCFFSSFLSLPLCLYLPLHSHCLHLPLPSSPHPRPRLLQLVLLFCLSLSSNDLGNTF
jgi:hypothetical protein